MSVELIAGRWYITTACPEPHNGHPCPACWPCHACDDDTHYREPKRMTQPNERNRMTIPPREPSARMRANANSMHETYVALTDAGFTQSEAMEILGEMIAASLIAGDDE